LNGLTPLVAVLQSRPIQRLIGVLRRKHSPRHRDTCCHLQAHEGARNIGTKDARMGSFSLHDAPESDHGMGATALGAIQQRLDRNGHLPGAWDANDLYVARSVPIQLVQGAFEKLLCDQLVPAANDDGESLSSCSHTARYRVHSQSMARFATIGERYLPEFASAVVSAATSFSHVSCSVGSKPYQTRRTVPWPSVKMNSGVPGAETFANEAPFGS